MYMFFTKNKLASLALIILLALILSPKSYAFGLLELKFNAPLTQELRAHQPTAIIYPKVQPNESLRQIAEKIRPHYVTVEQMMLALQRENPTAFYRDNVSFLNADSELRIANTATLDSVSAEKAFIEIQRQYREWLSFRRSRNALRASQASQTKTPQTITPNVTALQTAPLSTQAPKALSNALDTKSHSAITPGITSDAALGVVSNTALNSISNTAQITVKHTEPENALKKSQTTQPSQPTAGLETEAREILLGRLVALEGQMIKVQSLILMREKVIDQISREQVKLSANLRQLNEAASNKKAEALSQLERERQENIKLLKRLSVLESDIAVIQGLIELRETALQQPVLTTTIIKPTTTTQIISAENTKAVIRLNEPSIVASFGKNNQFLISFLVALLFIGIVWFIVHKRNVFLRLTKKTERDVFIVKPEVNDSEAHEPIEVIKFNDTSKLTENNRSENAIKQPKDKNQMDSLITSELVMDPLIEADVYLTYEKYDKAAALLNEAIKREPYRQELKLKLLEVFALSRNVTEFDKQAEILFASINKPEDEYLWQHALLLAQDLDTKNPRFKVEEPAPVNARETAQTLIDQNAGQVPEGITDQDLEKAMGLYTDEAVDNWEETSAIDAVNDIVSEAIDHAATHSVQSIQASTHISMNSSYFAGDGADNKLDLAKAYIEMGDHIGALDLLGDILNEGTEKQKIEAKEILALD